MDHSEGGSSLQAEHVAKEPTFHPNQTIITAGHDARKLIVLKIDGEVDEASPSCSQNDRDCLIGPVPCGEVTAGLEPVQIG